MPCKNSGLRLFKKKGMLRVAGNGWRVGALLASKNKNPKPYKIITNPKPQARRVTCCSLPALFYGKICQQFSAIINLPVCQLFGHDKINVYRI